MKVERSELDGFIRKTVDETPITDVHTHIFDTGFGDILLWGIDELLTYHYLVAEVMRYSEIPYETFWRMSKKEQADLIWKTLFIDRSPVSESNRGVLTVLRELGLDVASRDLRGYREFFGKQTPDSYVDLVFEKANIDHVVMTNDPFVDEEREVWLNDHENDPRFRSALRIDPLLVKWPSVYKKLGEWGYAVSEKPNEKTLAEVRRFLSDWIKRMDPVYMAASLPPDFHVPEDGVTSQIVERAILPVAREFDIPFAMMIGVKKLTNPELLLAGDSVGKAEIETVEYLCRNYPHNKFLLTVLSRENQHELVVTARKFRNLHIFGCWWFLNNPSVIDEITRERMEMLGLSFTPQHSDARVLDQLIYKWKHSRKLIGDILVEKYTDLLDTGWTVTEEEIERDVGKLFGGEFEDFLKRKF